jgi:hypothetical protein
MGLGIFFPEHKPILLETLQEQCRAFARGEWGKSFRGKVPPDAIHAMLSEEPIFVYAIEILMAHLARQSLRPRLTNTDGDALLQVEARYRCADAAALRAALLAAPNLSHSLAEGLDCFHWTNRQGIVVGTARLEASGILVAETNSRARHRNWDRKLKSLGDLTLLEKREQRLDPAASAGAAPAGEASASGLLTGEALEAVLPEIKAHLAERWLRERIPMLDGKTPVQAARTAKGRRQLEDLFAHIESLEARGPAGAFEAAWDVDEMKARLGLI